jgi:Prolyl oligopeptidase family
MRNVHFLLITIGIALGPGDGRADENADQSGGRVAWAESLVQDGKHSRLHITGSRWLAGPEKPGALVEAEFSYLDPHGKEKNARAKLYLPRALKDDAKAIVPLYFVAGYETTDPTALTYLKRGWAVVSPSAVDPNPLVRTSNPDIALLHIVRALQCVDDTKVVIAGGSAGGYMTLMLAAETFPLAGAAPDVAPVNWGYNGAYFFTQYDKVIAARDAKQGRDVPFLAAVTPMLKGAKDLYGTEYGDLTWFRHSPLSHLPTVTCPVSALWTSADVLVPMQQIGERWVRPFDPKEFPEGFTMDPARLTATREGRLRLMDVLAEEDYEVFTVAVSKAVNPAKPLELQVSPRKRWSITILDEGPPGSKVGHFKYGVPVAREEFLRRVLAAGLPSSQLTAPKLERLMDRYAGVEWLPTKLKHLDYAQSERADVLRGLRTFVKAHRDNAKTFAQLYRQLPPAKQVLEAQVVEQLVALRQSGALEWVQVAKEGPRFALTPSGRPFTPWGLNYGNAGRLIEDFWDSD